MQTAHHIFINPVIQDYEVPELREAVGWERRDRDYPALLAHCLFWAGMRDESGKLIAFGCIVGPGIEHGYMEDIIVHPQHQQKGIGKALVQKLLQESHSRGICIVTVTFEEKNAAFYQNCGFSPCSGGIWQRS